MRPTKIDDRIIGHAAAIGIFHLVDKMAGWHGMPFAIDPDMTGMPLSGKLISGPSVLTSQKGDWHDEGCAARLETL